MNSLFRSRLVPMAKISRITIPSRILTCQFHSNIPVQKLFGKKLNKPEEPRAKSVFDLPEYQLSKNPPKPIKAKEPPAIYATHPILKRVPKQLHRYVGGFINAPYSHVVSFIILHELTAVVPLFIIWYLLHLQPDHIPDVIPDWAIAKATAIIESSLGDYITIDNFTEKVQFIVEGAFAYTIVKFLLPLRLFFSFAAMPFGARVVVRFINRFKKDKIDMFKTPLVKIVEMQVDPSAPTKVIKGKKL